MSKHALRFLFTFEIFLGLFLLTSCGTMEPAGIQQARIDAAQKIAAEPPGDYFIGRRYFKGSVYKFWGYVRKPGQPWNTAQLVVLNEKEKLAPPTRAIPSRALRPQKAEGLKGALLMSTRKGPGYGSESLWRVSYPGT